MRLCTLASLAVIVCVCSCAAHKKSARFADDPDLEETPRTATATAAASPSTPMRTTGSLVLTPNEQVAIVADDDPPSVRAFDLKAKKEIWSSNLEGTPGHLTLARDGRVFVAMRELDRVDVLAVSEPSTDGVKRAAPFSTTNACVEPVGITLTPDESMLLVACAWSHELVGVSIDDGHVMFRVDLPLEPRAVIATPTGSHAVVSHAVGGRLTVIDLKSRASSVIELRASLVANPKTAAIFSPSLTGASMMTSNGFALAEHDGTIFSSVMTSMTDRGPNVAQMYYGTDINEGIVFPIVASDAMKNRWLYGRVGTPVTSPNPASSKTSASRFASVRGCLAPRGVAIRPTGWSAKKNSSIQIPVSMPLTEDQAVERVRPATSTRLVACPGNDHVVEHDETGAAIRMIPVPGNPSAIVVDQKDNAIVWSQGTRQLSTIDLRGGKIVDAIAATPRSASSPEEERARLGKRIFESVDDRRITTSGRACATCHPDGRADALTWGTPEGPRQTMMLAGRLSGTAPYGWSRGSKTLHGYVGETIRRLGGKGLPEEEMTALLSYVSNLKVPSAARFVKPITTIATKRGKAIFESSEAGCSSCHNGVQLTDSASHILPSGGSSSDTPASASSSSSSTTMAIDTPSLRFISNTAPYFHDGRYASLRQLLTEVDGKMGRTKHLSRDDLDALEWYLRTL